MQDVQAVAPEPCTHCRGPRSMSCCAGASQGGTAGGSEPQPCYCLIRETTWYEASYEDMLRGKSSGGMVRSLALM